MDDFRMLNNALCAGCNNEVGVRPDHFEMGHDSKNGLMSLLLSLRYEYIAYKGKKKIHGF